MIIFFSHDLKIFKDEARNNLLLVMLILSIVWVISVVLLFRKKSQSFMIGYSCSTAGLLLILYAGIYHGAKYIILLTSCLMVMIFTFAIVIKYIREEELHIFISDKENIIDREDFWKKVLSILKSQDYNLDLGTSLNKYYFIVRSTSGLKFIIDIDQMNETYPNGKMFIMTLAGKYTHPDAIELKEYIIKELKKIGSVNDL